jgi:hypothetical protein
MIKWTQNMAMHLNGGSKFSVLTYDLFADGKPTGITRHTRTSGSPKYLKTADELHCGQQTFDILGTHGKGMMDWLNARLLEAKQAEEQRAEAARADAEMMEDGGTRTPPRE